MTKNEVIALMQSSSSWQSWNANVDAVMASFNGLLPSFWTEAIYCSDSIDQQRFHEWGRKQMIVRMDGPNVFGKPIV